MNAFYAKQAALVIKVIPHIATENAFALKGGTAINLFEKDLPRLSVDVDLTYTVINSRDEAIREINGAIERISRRLTRFGINTRLTGNDVARKLICAALDRQHPRDLFDIAQFYKNESITDEIKAGFIAYALCHNRPPHELLNPILHDHKEIFDQQFVGMTDVPFTYDEHVATFVRLQQDLLRVLSDRDKEHLLAFASLQGSAVDFGIPNLDRLPGVVWKQKNLQTLKETNKAKFEAQARQLAMILNR